MKITLESFRTYLGKTVIDLPDEGATLIEGKSGTGKSTLFRAIHWALYGKDKNPYPWSSSKKKCMVELFWEKDKIKITRQKNPERLTVEVDIIQYTSEEAQQWIVRRWGSRENWVVSNYLLQSVRSTFVTGTSAEKLALLEEWCFTPGDHPGEWIDKFTKQKQLYQREYDDAFKVYEASNKTLDPLPDSLSLPLDDYSHESYTLAQTELTNLEKTWENLLQKDQKNLILQTTQKEYEGLLQEKKELADKAWTSSEWTLYKQYQITLQKYNQLQTEISQWNDPVLTEEERELFDSQDDSTDWNVLIQQQLAAEKILQKCRQNSLPSTQGLIQERVAKLKIVLAFHDKVTQWRSIKEDEDDFINDKEGLFDSDEIESIKYQEKKYNEWITWLKKYKWTVEEWVKVKDQLQKYLTLEKALKPYQVWQKSTKDYELWLETQKEDTDDEGEGEEEGEEEGDLPEDPEALIVFYQNKLHQLQQSISQGEKSTNVHPCPHCHQFVRIVQDTLQVSDTPPVSEETLNNLRVKVKSISKKIEYIQTIHKAYQQFSAFHTTEKDMVWAMDISKKLPLKESDKILKMEKIDCPKFGSIKMIAHNQWIIKQTLESEFKSKNVDSTWEEYTWTKNKCQQQLALTQTLLQDWVDSLPWSSQLMKNVYAYVQTCYRKRDLDNQLEEIDITSLPDDLNEVIDTQTILKGKRSQLELQEKKLIQSIKSLQTWLDSSKGSNPDQIKKTIEQTRLFLQECNVVLPWKKKQDQLITLKQRYESAEKSLSIYTQLVEKAKWLEHSILEQFLQTMNATLEMVTGLVFDDPLTIVFDVFKGERPSIQLSMLYKGGQNEPISEISGGELDRVSLAITIALANSSAFPCVLLDECFGSLDGETREKCLTAVKHLLSHKCVYIIAHGENEGDYEHHHKA
jgi:DNA repair exonuclease SbcCD ATPase subunit